MLPFEIFTLVLLSSLATAIPQLQHPKVSNHTASIPKETDRKPHTEFPKTGWDDIGEETTLTNTGGWSTAAPAIGVSETGWERTDLPQGPTKLIDLPSKSSKIIATISASIIHVHTEIQASITKLDPLNEPTPDFSEILPRPRSSYSNSPHPSSGGGLLDEIISHIHAPQPEARPTGLPSQTGDSGGPNGANNSEHGNENTALPEQTGTGLNAAITLGPATLTLTPGLSTTIGTDGSPTFISISTNAAGETIIIISSSGTAITATVTDVPITLTVPKTGFEASITAAARPADYSTPSTPLAAAATSGVVADRWRWGVAWWIVIAGSIVGGVISL